MTDYFALLKEARRPWLDAEALKNRFMELSAQCHPDKFPEASAEQKKEINSRYSELNAAWQCLSQTRSRLLHLLELESGGRPTDIQKIPPGTGELFMEVGQTCSQAGAFLKEKPLGDSPMLKAKRFVEQMGWTDKLKQLQEKIGALATGLEGELQQMNTALEGGSPLPLERVEEIYRSLSYIQRWNEQIREKIVELAVQEN
ncbi:MAG: J domain-containing protein [Limisphaerales bacterium]|jgi:hypothetical protein|nr:DnaJ domain-containing protein [Verrucomicrobiota bacterium]